MTDKKIIEKDGIFDYEEIIAIHDAFLTISNYADKIFEYLNTDKEKMFADKVRLANFGNKSYGLLYEFESSRVATEVHTILELDPDEAAKKNKKEE